MIEIAIKYTDSTRLMSVESALTGGKLIGGTVGDSNATRITFSFDPSIPSGYTPYCAVGANVVRDGRTVVNPEYELDANNKVILPGEVMSAAMNGKIPIQLHFRGTISGTVGGETVTYNSEYFAENQIVIELMPVIDNPQINELEPELPDRWKSAFIDASYSNGTLTLNSYDESAKVLQIDDMVRSNQPIPNGTKCKITYDEKGLVISGSGLSSSDIPDISDTYEIKSNKTQSIGTSIQPTSVNYPTDYAVQEFVNSSIATNTATFKGTYQNISDLPTSNCKMNDYAFIINDVSPQDPEYKRYKVTAIEPNVVWTYEYTLNNSSFTATQWAAINSGVTDDKIGTYDGYAAQIAAKSKITASGNQVYGANIVQSVNIDGTNWNIGGGPTVTERYYENVSLNEAYNEIYNSTYNKCHITGRVYFAGDDGTIIISGSFVYHNGRFYGDGTIKIKNGASWNTAVKIDWFSINGSGMQDFNLSVTYHNVDRTSGSDTAQIHSESSWPSGESAYYITRVKY